MTLAGNIWVVEELLGESPHRLIVHLFEVGMMGVVVGGIWILLEKLRLVKVADESTQTAESAADLANPMDEGAND